MNLTRISIEKNRITITCLLVVLLVGMGTYFQMPRAEDPGFIIRTAAVVTYFPGASPERVELLVTDKIEKVVQEIPELDFVNSESTTGQSFIFVNIKESEKVMQPIWDQLRRKVEALRGLPEGIIGPFINDEYGDVFGIIVAVTAEGYSYSDLKVVAEELREELLNLPDAAKVEISGVQDERIFIEYDNAKLAELGLSMAQLSSILSSTNILISGGSVVMGDERITLEPSGNFETVQDLRRTLIRLPTTGESVYLEDIAEVNRGYVDPLTTKVRTKQQNALALAISLREGGNLIDLGEHVEKKINELRQLYPYGVEFDLVAYQHQVVDKKVNDFVSNLLQAVGIVLAVMLLMLGIRTGLIVASLIPMAIVMAFMLMGWFEIGLDQVSLAALIIALGMLVDNAIVMSESIMVRLQQGEDRLEAALASARELAIPLLTASLTTSAAFLPIFLAKSTTGEYTAPLFKVVTITLLCSWILSLTMIPMLCYYFLRMKPKESGEMYQSKAYLFYKQVLIFCLKKPILVLVSAVGLMWLAIQGLGLVPSIFFPQSDRNLVVGTFELPIGTNISKTEQVIGSIETFLAEELQVGHEREAGVTSWMFWVGGNTPKYALNFNPKGQAAERATMLLNTSDHSMNQVVSNRIDSFCVANFPDLKAVVNAISLGPPVTDPVEIRIKGRELDRLFEIVDEVKDYLTGIPGTKTISDDWGARVKKLSVDVDQARARNAGVTSQDIAISLQTALSGFQTSEYREGDEIIPIIMRQQDADRQDIGKLEAMNIYSQQTGSALPLKQVANIMMEWEPSKILRRDRFKTVTVSSQLQNGYTAADVESPLFEWAEDAKKEWGIGYNFEIGGTRESSGEANAAIGAQVPVAFFLILLLLVIQFNSYRKPFIILATIPLGIIGVTFGLLVANSYMGFMTFLGIISLSGIVINNAIVLIDTIDVKMSEGLGEAESILASAVSRFRPILLTTCTTVLGLIPLWLGGGPMFEPMAIAIIFGLLFATVLTLIFVPVLYRLLYRVKVKDLTVKSPLVTG
ncbi:MAG: efflux RND transporter permease subunit [Saprospiraceae bacterium]|nr:efflux RND transporter permease subunit [Saprospiraceae bacterium]